MSSKKQAAEERTSLADQEKECRAYAARESWPVVVVGRDTQTGFETMDQRPALQEVRDLIQSSGADVLIVWRFDRAARDQVDLLVLNREVRSAGARLVSATEGPVEDNAAGRGLLSIRGMAAEIEREGLIARTRGAIRTRAESGKMMVGAVPKFGYLWEGPRKERLVVNPDTAWVVQRIYEMADQGMLLRAIAGTLNSEHILTPSQYLSSTGQLPASRQIAISWYRQQVYNILTDPTYKGLRVAYRRKVVKKGGKRKVQLREASDQLRIEQTCPALVSVEQWDRVQLSLSNNTLASGAENNQDDMPLLTRGIAYCGHCGRKAVATKHSYGYRGYACRNRAGRATGDQERCPGGAWFIKAETLDAEVWAQVSEMASNTEQFRRMILAPLRDSQAKVDQVTRQETRLEQELTDAKKEKETLVRRIGAQDDDQIAATYRTRLREVLSLIEGLENRQTEKDKQHAKLNAYLDALFSAASGWKDAEGNDVSPEVILGAVAPTPTRDQKRNLLRAIGARVLIYAGKSDYARENGKRWELQIVPDVYTGNETTRSSHGQQER